MQGANSKDYQSEDFGGERKDKRGGGGESLIGKKNRGQSLKIKKPLKVLQHQQANIKKVDDSCLLCMIKRSVKSIVQF